MIYQEVLTNMVKYTHPKHITININLEQETLYLEITNKFESSITLGHDTTSANRGISSIERRTNRINGKFSWTESTEGFQTTHLEVPNIFKSY
jgi:signal transduction histidine kinase